MLQIGLKMYVKYNDFCIMTSTFYFGAKVKVLPVVIKQNVPFQKFLRFQDLSRASYFLFQITLGLTDKLI